MIRVITLSCVALGVALIAMLFRASSNNAVFEQHYASLFWLGLALTVGLLILIGIQVYGLVKKIRGQVFGAKLGLRLMSVFALMAIIPGGLVYVISVQFLNRSVDSWFDVPVDRAFESALDLGRSALDSSSNDHLRRVRDAALKAADLGGDAAEVARQIRQQYNFDEVAIVNLDAGVTGWAGGDAAKLTDRVRLMPDKPTAAEVREAGNKGAQKFTETLSERAIYFRVLILIPAAPSIDGTRYLQVMQSAPRKLVGDAQSVESGVRDYQRLQLLRDGLKRVFALTLTLAMVLTLFSAISLSFLLSERLSAPLSALAESTRAIAKGDFTKLNPVKSRDEFGVLTQSFNTMTRQLSEASEVVARKQHELVTANAYLESILGNLTTGVVTLDQDLRAKSINPVAADMLGIEPARLKDLPFSEWGTVYGALDAMVADILSELKASRERTWERQFTITTGELPSGQANLPTLSQSTLQMKAARKRTVLVRGTRLPQATDADVILVFDDITGLIQAQRDAAWGEVARRLAHEIKNPLTPIQLSAERLQMKLADKLPTAEREMLDRATHTIVAQVGALKGMVDDFSLYSRASRMKTDLVDFNSLVRDVLALYQSMPARLVTKLADDLPTINADAALLRQVIHNLMQNAGDALTGVADATITVTTQRAVDGVLMTVADNGAGIREDVMARIFEPYVTTKAKGTGLGLPIVKKIIDEHRGRITAENTLPQGATITIFLPLTATLTNQTRTNSISNNNNESR
jgi:nitrogen fixation/metabolism regulation signal transduction histidine kinase